MKNIIYLWVFVTFWLLTACEEKNDSQIITSTTQLTFPAVGGCQTVDIQSNTDWLIKTDAAWVSVSPSTGNGNQTVTVTVALSENELEQNAKIIILTRDGEKVVNLNVKVKGTEVESGKHLDFWTFGRNIDRIFDGSAHAQDSIQIKSNVTWEVRGPSWLEVWDGSRWRPLSQERGVFRGTDVGMVYLRTAGDNKEENRLSDVVKVSEYLTGEYTREFDVSQLGRLEVMPELLEFSVDWFVFDWRCGCDVKKIYYKITDNMNEFINSTEELRNAEETDASFINSKEGLKPDTYYKWMCVGEDQMGNLPSKLYMEYSMHTSPDMHAAARIMTGYEFQENQWTFFIEPKTGELFGDYMLYATNNPNSAFRYNTPILSYIFDQQSWHLDAAYVRKPGWINYWPFKNTSNEVHAMTKILDGSQMLKTFRYDRYYDADGRRLPDKPLLDRIPKAMINDPSLR